MTMTTDWQSKYQNLLAVYLRQVETNRQQRKGLDRLRRKVEYYRQTTNGLVTLIQKSPCPEILFGNADRKYDGPKPGYKRPPTEDEIYDSQHPEKST